MCGIVGVMNGHQVAEDLIKGLSRLEYRGYDSAGIGTVSGHAISIRRAAGKIANLRSTISAEPIVGTIGIGHTRWATHGAPVVKNAHPHVANGVGVVHNGIIENHAALRAKLEEKGTAFRSETDSEVLPHLIAAYRDEGMSAFAATKAALALVEGQFAICAIFADCPDLMIAARLDSPLEIGRAPGDTRIASDMVAFGGAVDETIALENGEIAALSRQTVQIFDHNGVQQNRGATAFTHNQVAADKGSHRHFMLKEIEEQPVAIERTLASFQSSAEQCGPLDFELLSASHRMDIVACGTSRYAGNVAKYWMNEFAGIDVAVETASEYRYMPRRRGAGPALFISQSGETADTIACLRDVHEQGRPTISLVNAAKSTMENEADICLKTEAGPEIGVASTKAFTTQLTALLALARRIGLANGAIAPEQVREIDYAMSLLPSAMGVALQSKEGVDEIALDIEDANSVLFLGRGANFPIALEGALKLKEISYIHAEGFAAGELKHGPIALVDRHTPIVVVAPTDRWFAKTASNIEEVIARGGRVILITDPNGAEQLGDKVWHTITIPDVPECIQPIVATVPLQLLAYRVACLKGTDVDQPRNLAKSVTVE